MFKVRSTNRSVPAQGTRTRTVLNTGSGPAHSEDLHPMFRSGGWRQLRLDIEPANNPDIVASITDMRPGVEDASADAIWCSHNLEHLRDFEVQTALAEFKRVLRPDGFAFITCPDLEQVARHMLERGIDSPAYTSPAGPIAPIDMLFGHSASIQAGRDFMSHRTGFTLDRLGSALAGAGFDQVFVAAGPIFDLWALALMPDADKEEIARALDGGPQAHLLREDAEEAGRDASW